MWMMIMVIILPHSLDDYTREAVDVTSPYSLLQ